MLSLLTAAALSGWAFALWPSASSSGVPEALPASVIAADTQSPESPEHSHEEEGAPASVIPPPSVRDRTAAGREDIAAEPAFRQPTEAEERARRVREEQDVLQAKEEILRSQLSALELELDRTPEPGEELREQMRVSTRMLVALMQDSRKAEEFLRTSLSQIWEAEGRAVAIAAGVVKNVDHLSLLWPVEPFQGISAYWHDKAYQQRFKMQHNAVDIPVPQGTLVLAAAGGIVTDVVDHGLGFNYVTVEHPGGYSTLYGHLTKFTVQKGQTIIAGDPVGYSGGRPGTPGAGFSTGPHLHFGVFMNGTSVDPMRFLPQIPAK